MARVPAAGVMTTSPMPPATMQALEEQRRKAVAQQTGGDAVTSYTIAAGHIKPTVRNFAVDTEGAAASDDLTHLDTDPDIAQAGFPGHGLVILRAADTGRTVVVKNLAGNIDLAGSDFSLDDDAKRLVLVLRGSTWHEVARFFGSDVAARRSYLSLTNLSTLAAPVPVTDDGKYVGASGGGWTYQTAPSGGSGHKARSLSYASDNRNYSQKSAIRFERVELGSPVTDDYAFTAPAGAKFLQLQVLARLEQNPEKELFGAQAPNFVGLRVAYKAPSAAGFDSSGLSGARGLPSRHFYYGTGTDRLREGNVTLAAAMIPVTAGGQVNVVIDGDVATTYRARGGRTRTWLSLQWM